MSYNDWKDKTVSFKKIDVRDVQGNFFPGLKMQAAKMAVGEGMEIIQSFEPIPLYEVLEDLGFEHYTEKVAEAEYHTYFYRAQMKQAEKVEKAQKRAAKAEKDKARRKAEAEAKAKEEKAE